MSLGLLQAPAPPSMPLPVLELVVVPVLELVVVPVVLLALLLVVLVVMVAPVVLVELPPAPPAPVVSPPPQAGARAAAVATTESAISVLYQFIVITFPVQSFKKRPLRRRRSTSA